MKTNTFLYSIAAAALLQNPASAATLLFEDFEDDTLTYSQSAADNGSSTNWWGRLHPTNTATSGAVGLSGHYTNTQGSGFFGSQDMDAVGATNTATITFENLDISGYTNLEFSGFFAESGDSVAQQQLWNSGGLVVAANIDGGGYTTIFAVLNGDGINGSGPSAVGVPYVATSAGSFALPDGAEIVDAFTEYLAGISGTGSSLDLQITVNKMGDSREDIAFDNITISGTPIPEPSGLLFVGLGMGSLCLRRRR